MKARDAVKVLHLLENSQKHHGYEGMEKMFYFFHKVITIYIVSIYTLTSFIKLNSHNLVTANQIAHVIFMHYEKMLVDQSKHMYYPN